MLRRNPLWPYLLVLIALFALIVNAPRRWERFARTESLSDGLSRREHRGSSELPVYHYIAPESAKLQPVVVAIDLDDPLDGTRLRDERSGISKNNETTSQFNADAKGSAANPPQPALPPQAVPIGNLLADEPATASAQQEPALPIPTALLKQLDITAKIPGCAHWAGQIDTLLARLTSAETDDQSALATVQQLDEIAADGDALVEQLYEETKRTTVRRLQYALVRRGALWKAVIEHRAQPSTTGIDESLSDEEIPSLRDCTDALRRMFNSAPEGLAWQEFLLLDEIEKRAANSAASGLKAKTAHELLARLSDPSLSPGQQEFISQHPITLLARHMTAWKGEVASPLDVLAHLEQFEETGASSDSAKLASDVQRMRWSRDSAHQVLADHLDEHYRNANIRLAVSAELVNRLVPQPEAREMPVRDHILGADVRGRSTIITKLLVRLTPDASRLRIGIEARGRVLSNTTSTSGPATFYNTGESTFLARKDFLFGHRGLQIYPATAQAENQFSSLRGMETDYDQIPLIGSIVRNIARNEHDSAQGQARHETENRIASQSGSQLDAEVEPRIREAKMRFKQKVQAPLDKLALQAAPIDMSTTAERLTVRLRVAGHDQLGAYTARPRALSNSVISLQIHESALNNTLARLDLDGREFTLPELYHWIGRRLSRPDVSLPDDLPEDVTVKFAAMDAVQLRCEDEHVEIRLAIARLKQGRKQWSNFAVRTFYRPDHTQLQAQFVRDSAIFLDGDSLKGKPQVVLRAIFSKVLSQKRPWSIIDEKLASDPRLQDLQITQFVTDQGWIALAYGPQGTPAVARLKAAEQK